MTITEFLLARIAEDEANCGPEDANGLAYCDAAEGAHYGAARVLAECEAKRLILGSHLDKPEEEWAEYAVRCVAWGYRHHEDWRPEWAPEPLEWSS